MKFYGQMCLLVGGLIAAAVGLAQPAGPPNILLLVAEDLSPRIGAWGDEVASTPNIDALARQSVRYTQAFTAAGVCAPSRAALIMGQHQISFGAQHMRTSTGPLGEYYAQPDPELKAFPELLWGLMVCSNLRLNWEGATGPPVIECLGRDWNMMVIAITA